MIKPKTHDEIIIMQEGGRILHDVLEQVLIKAQDNISLIELDNYAENLIKEKGAEPSFKKVKDYRYTTCLCVNDVVVHGLPTKYQLINGDILGIDCGVYYRGFHTDSAATKIIGNSFDKKLNDFLDIGKLALKKAISKVVVGNHIYDISSVIQETVETQGYSIVRSLVGHGIGRNLHEEPEIPGFINKKRSKTPKIVDGMVLAIEVIYNMGNSEVVYKGNDGWTISTKDGKISGLFEATVAATSRGNIVLT